MQCGCFGSSRFSFQESAVTTFRDLTLNEIDDDECWRGRVWIIDAEKLHGDSNGE